MLITKRAAALAIVAVLLLTMVFTSCGSAGTDNINAFLEPLRQKYNMPAFAALVILDGNEVAKGAVGERKYGSGVRVTEDDVWHLGSAGKNITATLAAVLVEQGKLKWTTTMPELFPEFADRIQPNLRGITLVHLLSHRSGFPNEPNLWPEDAQVQAAGEPETIMQRRNKFAEAMLCSPENASLPDPGSKWIYSNSNYMVAAAVAERLTGKSWEELITDLIFKPLNMTSARFSPQVPDVNRIDQPWPHLCLANASPGTAEKIREYFKDPDMEIYPEPIDIGQLTAPAGGMLMSLSDWGKYINEHIKGSRGESKFLSKETFDMLHNGEFEDGFYNLGGEIVDNYALGWGVEYRSTWTDSNVITHPGSTGLNWAEVWVAPDQNFAVMVTTNINAGPTLTAHKACIEVRDAMAQKFLNR